MLYNTIIVQSQPINQAIFVCSGQVNQYSFATSPSSSQTVVVSTGDGNEIIAPAPDGTEEKIRSFSTLTVGWHYGDGRPPSQQMIATAIQWHRTLIRLGFTVTDAFPGANGEIMVTAYQGAHYVELLLDTISAVSLIHEHNSEEVRSLDHVTPDHAFRALVELAGKIWNTSGYSIQNISTVNLGSSRASLSRSMTTGRPSSSVHVSLESGTASASTYGDFIRTSGANRRYSGSLTIPSFQRVAA